MNYFKVFFKCEFKMFLLTYAFFTMIPFKVILR